MNKKNYTLEDMTDVDLLQSELTEIHEAHALIVRHGYSESNAGMVTKTPSDTLLTDQGHRQGKFLADFLPHNPPTIIHSPYVRTKLTAGETIKRFPKAEVSEWPVQEYTYMNPLKHSGTTHAERKPDRQKYWEVLDPEYCDGSGAESFADIWKRVEEFRERLESLAPGSVIFSHGQFMRVLMMQIQSKYQKPTQEAMRAFRAFDCSTPTPNTARIAIRSANAIGEIKASHLPANLITY